MCALFQLLRWKARRFGGWLICGSANPGFDMSDDDDDAEYVKRPTAMIDASDFVLDIREYDVPYHVRVAIDKGTSFSTFSSYSY